MIEQIRDELGEDAARALQVIVKINKGDLGEALALVDGMRAELISRIETEARDVTPPAASASLPC